MAYIPSHFLSYSKETGHLHVDPRYFAKRGGIFEYPPLEICKERVIQKTAGSTLGVPLHPPVQWDPARWVTPGMMCGFQYPTHVTFFSYNSMFPPVVQVFQAPEDSQGLIYADERVMGASVSTQISSAIARKDERKTTYIQYDRQRYIMQNADFLVDPLNYESKITYQGGHLIDHQFSAEDSHTTENNYIPVHFYYNSPIKQYLVKRCDAYVEIPLYTPHPPQLGVKGQRDKYHDIPVGMIVIQITGRAIQDVYYFPNNRMDYRGIVEAEKGKAATLARLFRLDPDWHPLFQGAMLNHSETVESAEQQIKHEESVFSLVDDMTEGMNVAACFAAQSRVSQLMTLVFNQQPIDPRLFLSCTPEEFSRIQDQPLDLPFQTLGQFLIDYALDNALKSEALSSKSSLIFINTALDYLEEHWQLDRRLLDRLDHVFEPRFDFILESLLKLAPSMGMEEIVFLLQTYSRLLSPHLSDLTMDIFSGRDDAPQYFTDTIQILKILVEKYPLESLDQEYWRNLIDCLERIQEGLSYLVEAGFILEIDDYQEETTFLENLSKSASALLEKIDRPSGVFKTNINHIAHVRTSRGYLQGVMGSLGKVERPA